DPEAIERAQLNVADMWRDHRPHDEAEIDLPVLDLAGEIDAGIDGKVDGDIRIGLFYALDQARQPGVDDRVDRADHHRAAQTAGVADGALELADHAHDRLGLRQSALAVRRQADIAQIALEQAHAEIAFQRGDAVRD